PYLRLDECINLARQGKTASTYGDANALANAGPNVNPDPPAVRVGPADHVILGPSGMRSPAAVNAAGERSAAEADKLRPVYELVSQLSHSMGMAPSDLLRRLTEAASQGSDWQKALQTMLDFTPGDLDQARQIMSHEPHLAGNWPEVYKRVKGRYPD